MVREDVNAKKYEFNFYMLYVEIIIRKLGQLIYHRNFSFARKWCKKSIIKQNCD